MVCSAGFVHGVSKHASKEKLECKLYIVHVWVRGAATNVMPTIGPRPVMPTIGGAPWVPWYIYRLIVVLVWGLVLQAPHMVVRACEVPEGSYCGEGGEILACPEQHYCAGNTSSPQNCLTAVFSGNCSAQVDTVRLVFVFTDNVTFSETVQNHAREGIVYDVLGEEFAGNVTLDSVFVVSPYRHARLPAKMRRRQGVMFNTNALGVFIAVTDMDAGTRVAAQCTAEALNTSLIARGVGTLEGMALEAVAVRRGNGLYFRYDGFEAENGYAAGARGGGGLFSTSLSAGVVITIFIGVFMIVSVAFFWTCHARCKVLRAKQRVPGDDDDATDSVIFPLGDMHGDRFDTLTATSVGSEGHRNTFNESDEIPVFQRDGAGQPESGDPVGHARQTVQGPPITDLDVERMVEFARALSSGSSPRVTVMGSSKRVTAMGKSRTAHKNVPYMAGSAQSMYAEDSDRTSTASSASSGATVSDNGLQFVDAVAPMHNMVNVDGSVTQCNGGGGRGRGHLENGVHVI